MHRLAMMLVCCAWAARAASTGAGVCPDGQCPAWGAPAEIGAPPYAADGQVDARPICRIVNTHPAGRSLGTGTLVDVDGREGLVLTCAHLFREGRGVLVVYFPDGTAYGARLVRIDVTADLAALAIAAPNLAPVELAPSEPQQGDPLISCGYGSDGRLWCNRGQALGYVTTLGSHGRETLELTGSARLGDSGGPVFDRHGCLVAVLFGTNGRVVDGTFCGRIRRFLDGLSQRFGRRRGQARGVEPEPQPTPIEPPPREAPDAAAPAAVPPPQPDDGSSNVAAPPSQHPCPEPPRVELPPVAGPPDRPGPLDAAEPWLAAKLTALLVSVGLPSGLAGVAGGAIVWLVMRRARGRLEQELARRKVRLGEASDDETATAATVVERHHNRYVPFEIRELDRAWATAHARVGEKYPGAVPYLKIVEGVKDQLLSGNDEPQIS